MGFGGSARLDSLMLYLEEAASEEAERVFIFILKNFLSIFPPVGESFRLRVKDEMFDVHVDGVSCLCVGPDKPHEHFRIDAKSFKELLNWNRGETVIITKRSDREYQLD